MRPTETAAQTRKKH